MQYKETPSHDQVEVAAARSAVYLFLSNLFLPGGLEGQEKGAMRPLLQRLPGFPLERLDPALSDMEAGLASETEGHEERYRHVFAPQSIADYPPFEGMYGQAHMFQEAHTLADISGFYRAFGMEPGSAKERWDHVGIECEFMAFMAWKEAVALVHHGEEKVEVCRETQRKFFAGHLGRFAPAFANRLERKAKDPLFQGAASVFGEFLAWDALFMGVAPGEFSLPLSMVQEEGFSCENGMEGER